MTHLTSILTNVQSKPKILFEAMGVATTKFPTSSLSAVMQEIKNQPCNDAEEQKVTNNNVRHAAIFWTMDKDGKGVKLEIPQPPLTQSSKVTTASATTSRTVSAASTIGRLASVGTSIVNIKNVSGFGGVSSKTQNDDNHKHKHNHKNNHKNNSSSTNQHDVSTRINNDNEPYLQRITTKLHRRFTTNQLATSSIHTDSKTTISTAHHKSNNSNNNINNNNNNNNNITLEIQCRECGTNGPEGAARAFLQGPTPLSIVLCTNRLSLANQDEIDEVLTHELIHVFDVHFRKWDFSDCATLAKSEIRAAREAECGGVGFWKEKCVKDKAREATKNMFPYKGIDCVNQVFKEGMVDTVPFRNLNGQETDDDMSTMATSSTTSFDNNDCHVSSGVITGRAFMSRFSSSG